MPHCYTVSLKAVSLELEVGKLVCDIKEMENLGVVPHFEQLILGLYAPNGDSLCFNRIHTSLMFGR